MKRNRLIAWSLMAPALLLVAAILLYPSLRTFVLSFHEVPSLTSSASEWRFVGLSNYRELFSIRLYRISLTNIALIWAMSGVLTIGLALLLASALTSGIRFAKIFTMIIYLPEVMSSLALGYIWLLFVYNPRFGLFQWFGDRLPFTGLSAIRWTAPDTIFYAMMIAGTFAAVGYFTLMYISALKKVPQSLYEAAKVEGASRLQRFFGITLPLIRGETASIMLIFSMATINYFAFPLVFGGVGTMTPMLFTYNAIFGSDLDTTTNVGVGAASTVVLLMVAIILFILNKWLVRNAKHYF